MKTLVLVDFDHTLITKDSLFEIARHATSKRIFYGRMLLLSPLFLLSLLGLLSRKTLKERFLNAFFGSLTRHEFDTLCQNFAKNKIEEMLNMDLFIKLKDHVKSGSKVIIVSASPENWIKPWAANHGVEVIGTKLTFESDRITGKIDGKNCNGEEKVRRIKESVDLNTYEKIIGYGDSKGDLPMLALASERYFKSF